MTNFEAIKNMSLDDMADLIYESTACDICPARHYCRIKKREGKNLGCLLNEWLESEAQDA